MEPAARETENIDDMLVVTIRVRVAAIPTFLRHASGRGGGYTLDNRLAREVCEQDLEISFGPDEDLVTVLDEMAEAVRYERLYGWMAQYRANIALSAGEIVPDANAHLHPVSVEIFDSLEKYEPREPRGNPPLGEQGPAQTQPHPSVRSSTKARDVAREADRRQSRNPAAREATPLSKVRTRKTPKGAE
jgi:hypothetical protein